MNDRAQSASIGAVLLVVGFILALALFSTIDPLKESLDNNRGDSSLNCPGTPDHDPVDYGNDTDFEKLVRRPTCFVTGLSMVWFVSVFLIAVAIWIVKNWRGKR